MSIKKEEEEKMKFDGLLVKKAIIIYAGIHTGNDLMMR